MSERFMHRWSGGHSTALLQLALVVPHLPNSAHRFRTQVGLVLPLVNFLGQSSAAAGRFALRGDMMEWGNVTFFHRGSPLRRFLGDDAARRRRKADRRIRCVARRRLPQQRLTQRARHGKMTPFSCALLPSLSRTTAYLIVYIILILVRPSARPSVRTFSRFSSLFVSSLQGLCSQSFSLGPPETSEKKRAFFGSERPRRRGPSQASEVNTSEICLPYPPPPPTRTRTTGEELFVLLLRIAAAKREQSLSIIPSVVSLLNAASPLLSFSAMTRAT